MKKHLLFVFISTSLLSIYGMQHSATSQLPKSDRTSFQQIIAHQRSQQLQRTHGTMNQQVQRMYQAWQQYQRADAQHVATMNSCTKFKNINDNLQASLPEATSSTSSSLKADDASPTTIPLVAQKINWSTTLKALPHDPHIFSMHESEMNPTKWKNTVGYVALSTRPQHALMKELLQVKKLNPDEHKSYQTFTPLMKAIHNRDEKMARLLLRYGANPCKQYNGYTARHMLQFHSYYCETHGCPYETKTVKNRFEKCPSASQAWSPEFLRIINGKCFECKQLIGEIGYVYECGHVLHRACKKSDQCSQCIDWVTFLEEMPCMTNELKDAYGEIQFWTEFLTFAATEIRKENNEPHTEKPENTSVGLFGPSDSEDNSDQPKAKPSTGKEKADDDATANTQSEIQPEVLRIAPEGVVLPAPYTGECHIPTRNDLHSMTRAKLCALTQEQHGNNHEYITELIQATEQEEQPRAPAQPSSKQYHCLFEAAKFDLDQVKERIEKGEDPNKGFLYRWNEEGEEDGKEFYSNSTALHAALFNNQQEIARYLILHGANLLMHNQYKLTPRHSLQRCTMACRGKHETYENRTGRHALCPNAETNWSKDLLREINQTCCRCDDFIEEVGHIYACGHVIHKACVSSSPQCLECSETFREKLDRIKRQQEKSRQNVEKIFAENDRISGRVRKDSPTPNPQPIPAQTNTPASSGNASAVQQNATVSTPTVNQNIQAEMKKIAQEVVTKTRDPRSRKSGRARQQGTASPSASTPSASSSASATAQPSLPQPSATPSAPAAPASAPAPTPIHIPTRDEISRMSNAQLRALTREQRGSNAGYILARMGL